MENEVNDTRRLSDADSAELVPGDEHYRAFVGPPGRYDLMGAAQFRLLTTLGLRETHRVLDFGCGSLRAGRMLLSYLQQGGYYGVEPNQWLLDDAVERQLGGDILRVKQPRFSTNADFTVPFRDQPFDFVLAQSIFSHTGRALVRKLLGEFAQVLAPKGMIAATFSIGDAANATPEDVWVYPGCVRYRQDDVVELAHQAGLAVTPIPFFHPTQRWFLMAGAEDVLPSREHHWLLTGGVLNVTEFAGSLGKPKE
ncbi:class I SAM-dependent methyltransferase [Methyloversatilis sp. NSM2]|uniref:class I SAM-dependent methyltransferase n=1 Tax=Methyloversatilis sp. NSM2 TaxID=3134135 RepID=UPI003115C5F3